MTYIKITLIIFLSMINISCGEKVKAKKPEYDFRNTKWGMSIADVRKAEDNALVRKIDHNENNGSDLIIKSDFSLEYKGKIYDLDCVILYGFYKNRLVSAKYKIITPYSLFVYYELKEVLAEKFKSLEKEKLDFSKEGEKTFKMSRAIFENEKTALTLTAVYPDGEKSKTISGIKSSYVNVDYESKAHNRFLNSMNKVPEDL